MRGASLLKHQLVASLEVEDVAATLRLAKTPAELAKLWWEHADRWPEGDARDLLRDVYTSHLRSLGALAG